MTERNDAGEVRAAGAVIRCGNDVLVIHRPFHDDWSFPKGKVEHGETDEACAVREVEEEAGLRVVLGRELPTIRWVDAGGNAKVCRYWLADVLDDAAPTARNEVDRVEWVPVEEAARRLTYPSDAELLKTL